MSTLDAGKKAGWAVGAQIVVVDENGVKVSDTESEWYGFEREMANGMAMALLDGVEAVIQSFPQNAGKAQQKRR